MSADEVDGASPGRSLTMSSGVIIQALTFPKSGSIGGRGGISRLFHAISPRATVLSASAFHSAASPPAAPMPSAFARAMNTGAIARKDRVFRGIRGQVVHGNQRLDGAVCIRRRRAVVEVFVVPGYLQRFELRDRDVAIGTCGIRRIAEWKLRIGKRVVRVRHRIGAVGAWRRW